MVASTLDHCAMLHWITLGTLAPATQQNRILIANNESGCVHATKTRYNRRHQHQLSVQQVGPLNGELTPSNRLRHFTRLWLCQLCERERWGAKQLMRAVDKGMNDREGEGERDQLSSIVKVTLSGSVARSKLALQSFSINAFIHIHVCALIASITKTKPVPWGSCLLGTVSL